MVNEEWLYGEMGPNTGQFPVQFVDHVPQGLPPWQGAGQDRTAGTTGAGKPVDRLSQVLSAWGDEPDQKKVRTLNCQKPI